MPEIKINIPDGEYCDGCPFMHDYTHNLIDIMGNETGSTRLGTRCSRFNTDLEVLMDGCFIRVKKCYMCGLTDEEAMGHALWLLLFKMIDKDKENNNE